MWCELSNRLNAVVLMVPEQRKFRVHRMLSPDNRDVRVLALMFLVARSRLSVLVKVVTACMTVQRWGPVITLIMNLWLSPTLLNGELANDVSDEQLALKLLRMRLILSVPRLVRDVVVCLWLPWKVPLAILKATWDGGILCRWNMWLMLRVSPVLPSRCLLIPMPVCNWCVRG